MGKYAIVEIGGKQYKVGVDSELVVDKLEQADGAVTFDKVLLLVEDGAVKVGTPNIQGASVIAKVLGQEKGRKLHVIKFRAKSRYRRKLGFRPLLTRIRIEEIKMATSTTNKPPAKSDTVNGN